MIDRRIGKIRIRRGTDAQRKGVVFPEGELVYSIDKKKIYVGNDTKYGGVLVSNKNYVVDVLGSPQIPENANYGSIIHEITTKKTYVVGYDTDKTTLKLFIMFDLNGSEIQINTDSLKQRLSAVETCISTRSPKPPEPPKEILWVTQPVDVYIDEQQTATFTASATYTSPVAYTWFRSDKNTIHSGSTTNNTLIISDAQLADGVAYYCVASSTFVASITSNIATLHVTALPVLVGPSIVTHPKSQNTIALVPITFTIDAVGSTPLSYQWMIDGTDVVGATGTSYIIENPTKDVSVTCKVSNSVGNITSNIAKLTIVTPPAIITQPKSQTIIAGRSATLSVAAIGTAPLTYKWYTNNVIISGATGSSYSFIPQSKSESIASIYLTKAKHGGGGSTGVLKYSNLYNLFTGGFKPSNLTLYGRTNQSLAYINGVLVADTGNNNTKSWSYNASISPNNNGSFTYQASDFGNNYGGGWMEINIQGYTYSRTISASYKCSVSNLYGSVTSNIAEIT